MIYLTNRSENLTKVAKEIMKQRNMRITSKHVPETSKYTIRLNPDTRVRVNVSDNELGCYQEVRLGDEWVLTARKFVQGTVEEIEKAFTETIESISNIMRK